MQGEMLDFLSAGEPAVMCYAASWPRCGSDDLDIELDGGRSLSVVNYISKEDVGNNTSRSDLMKQVHLLGIYQPV